MRPSFICAFLGLLIPLSGSAQARGADRSAADLQACRPHIWDEPTPLVSADRRPYYIEAPSSVALAKGVALFGAPTYRWESPTIFLSFGETDRHAGVLIGRDSTVPIPYPTGVKYMIDPLGISDGRGGAHVFWGTSPADENSFKDKVTGIAYSHYDGERWTPPEQLVTATNLTWWRTGRDIVRRNDEIDVVTPGFTTIAGKVKLGTVLVKVRGGTKEVSWDDLGKFVNHMALARGPGDALLTILIASLDTARGKPVYGLYIKSSESSDTSARPRLIRAFTDDSAANWVSAVRTRRTLHLFWIEMPSRAGWVSAEPRPARIQHAMSDDDGASFRMGAPFDLPKGTDELVVSTLGDTVLLAVREPVSRQIGIVEWHTDRWGPLIHPFREWSMSAPAFIRTSGDSIQLTWGVATTGVVPAMPSYSAPSQRMAVLRRHCPPSRR